MLYVLDLPSQNVSFFLERALLLVQEFRLFYEISCVCSIFIASFFEVFCQSPQIQHFFMQHLVAQSGCFHLDVRDPTHHSLRYFSTLF